MKNYRILKSFKGSQTGHDCHEFEAGTEALLSDSLAEVVVKEGWAEPVIAEKFQEIELTMTREEAEEYSLRHKPHAVEERETKVIVPEETKPVKKPLAKKSKQ